MLSTPIELDRQQIGTFGAIIHGNSRPVQALNGRTVSRTSCTKRPRGVDSALAIL